MTITFLLRSSQLLFLLHFLVIITHGLSSDYNNIFSSSFYDLFQRCQVRCSQVQESGVHEHGPEFCCQQSHATSHLTSRTHARTKHTPTLSLSSQHTRTLNFRGVSTQFFKTFSLFLHSKTNLMSICFVNYNTTMSTSADNKFCLQHLSIIRALNQRRVFTFITSLTSSALSQSLSLAPFLSHFLIISRSVPQVH